MPVDRRVTWFTLLAALAGTAVSAYLTVAHYTGPDLLVCAEGGTVSCSTVTSSAQSEFFGIPVALLGLIWFMGMTTVCLPAAWRAGDRRIHRIRLVSALVGMGFVLWLVYAELIIIGALCLWCTVAHILAFGLFAAIVSTSQAVQADSRHR